MGIALALAEDDVRSFRLSQPFVRTSSFAEVSAIGVLLTSALGLWLLVLPLELLALVAR